MGESYLYAGIRMPGKRVCSYELATMVEVSQGKKESHFDYQSVEWKHDTCTNDSRTR
jgi:hypothetical protein